MDAGRSQRYARSELLAAAAALEALASLMSEGRSFLGAVAAWDRVMKEPSDVRSIARSARLGVPLTVALDAVAAGVLARAMRPVAQTQRGGACVHPMSLRSAAAALRLRASEIEAAEAGAAGVRLSGRMVAGLPLAFLVLVPASGGFVWDAASIGMVAVGACLVAVGMRWMTRLLPRPSELRPEIALAIAAADLCRGGSSLHASLAGAAEGSDHAVVRHANAAVRLGASWESVLTSTGTPGFVRLAASMERARRVGYGHVAILERFIAEEQAAAEIDFERRLRRAPVVMVLPLVLCILPAFGLVALGPFLRSLVA